MISIPSELCSHRKLKEPVSGIKRGLDRGINVVTCFLATAEHLHLSAFKSDIDEHRDQIFSKRINVVEVCKRGCEAPFGGFLHRLQSGYSSRFQGAHPGGIVYGVGLYDPLAKGDCYLRAASPSGLAAHVYAVESQSLLIGAVCHILVSGSERRACVIIQFFIITPRPLFYRTVVFKLMSTAVAE